MKIVLRLILVNYYVWLLLSIIFNIFLILPYQFFSTLFSEIVEAVVSAAGDTSERWDGIALSPKQYQKIKAKFEKEK